MTRKTKRHICGWIAAIAFVLMFGFVGGVECGTLPITRGAILMFSSLAVWAGAMYKGGWLK